MSVQLDNEVLRGHLRAIVDAADGPSRSAAADALIVGLVQSEVLEVWGRNLSRHYGRPNDHEEATSVLTERLLNVARSLTQREFDAISTPASFLYFQAKAGIQKWLDSPAVTLASEMSGIARRHRRARVAARELREKLGREPEASEVVAFANERALQTRKDAARQGALISVADVEGVLLRAYSMDYSDGDRDSDSRDMEDRFGTPNDGGLELAAEVSFTVTQLQDHAARAHHGEERDEVQAVIGAWAQLILEGEPTTASALSSRTGIGRHQIPRRLAQMNAVLEGFRSAAASG